MTEILTQTKPTTSETTQELAFTIASAADDRKAGDIVILKTSDVSYLTDYFVIVTGYSRVQLRAISQAIEEQVKLNYHRHPLRVEGKNDSNWVLQDYGDVIVHILLPEERDFYNLEAFWGHAERIDFSASALGA